MSISTIEGSVGSVIAPNKRKSRQKFCLPFAKWPNIDRAAWIRAQTKASLFDDDAPLARLSQWYVCSLNAAYGLYLGHLSAIGELDHGLSPGQRVTIRNVQSHIDMLLLRVTACTVRGYIRSLATVLQILTPESNYRWVCKLPGYPSQTQALASAKPINPPNPVAVLRAALDRFDNAASMPLHLRPAVKARDALIVAFAVTFAVRRKNLSEMTLGVHLLEDAAVMRLQFSNSLKTSGAVSFIIPKWLASRLRFYLDRYRPKLLGDGQDNGVVWICMGGKEFSPLSVKGVFRKFGMANLGRPLNCHVFRHVLANTLILRDPGDADLIAAALGHASTRMVEQVYTKSVSTGLSHIWLRKFNAHKRRLGLS